MGNFKTNLTILPDFIEIQRKSFCWFISQGLNQEFTNISSIINLNNIIEICIFGQEYRLKKPKYNEFVHKQHDSSTYSARIYLPIELRYKEFKNLKKKKRVFIGTLPLMTNDATFIINGCERIIISQIIRSPGIYYKKNKNNDYYTATLVLNRGSWLKFEFKKETRKEEKKRINSIIETVRIRLGQKLGFDNSKDLGLLLTDYFIEEEEIIDEDELGKHNLIYQLIALICLKKLTKISLTQKNDSEKYIKLLKYCINHEENLLVLKSVILDYFKYLRLLYSLKPLIKNNFKNKLISTIRKKENFIILYALWLMNLDKVDILLSNSSFQDSDIDDDNIKLLESYILEKELIRKKKYQPKHKKIKLFLRLNKDRKIFAIQLLQELNIPNQVIYHSLQNSWIFQNELEKPNSRISSGFSKIFNSHYYNLGEIGRRNLNARLNLKTGEHIQTLTYQDLLNIIDELTNISIKDPKVSDDDIDHLQNKRIRSVGELLQNQFRIGLNRLERTIRERVIMCDPILLSGTSSIKPNMLIDPKPIMVTMKEFFNSSQLSQFMDQTNPLSSLTHKRRISGLGPGGLSRDRISFTVRDIHPSHYGRICPIETPEGQNAGLIASLTTYAYINDYGFIETPFWRVINGQVLKKEQPFYLTAKIEDHYKIAPGDILINKNSYITKTDLSVRYKQEFLTVSPGEVDFIGVSPIQIVSAGASLIPFFEHDDANRALMGSNMQRQSVPLLLPQRPIVGTGLENQVAMDSGMVVTAFQEGIVEFVSAKKIIVNELSGKKAKYFLQKYYRSNQETCINQRPIVWPGEKVKSGQVIADGPSTEGGELALGQNITVAYMPWQGYNFEDAILINERLLYEDIFSSIHIEKYDIEIRQTKVGSEIITRDIPNTSQTSLKKLDPNGIVYKGTFVMPGDVLVGKMTPKEESEQLPEGNLLRAIFGIKGKDVRDSSFRVPNREYGRVLDIKVFSRENGDELSDTANALIRIFIAQIRKIQVGDKIAGRHGNKGIISRILSRQDMPYLPDGTEIDIILNPLGVPSRMNVGQLYESLLGFAGYKLNQRFKILPFDEMFGEDMSRILINKKLRQASLDSNEAWLFNPYCPGKIVLIDGRTGKPFENPITVGKAYMLKLIHLVDDKIHARSTGPYSLITQQPLGGKSQHGGQRFGEMEVWALEAFGAAYTLQELLTLKSDDMEGRNNTVKAIVKGHSIPKPGIPESFKVLMRELQSIGLDIGTYKIGKFNSEKNFNTEVSLM